eukprot:Phypoly_transcript_15030.p1 GENE.Phypoly_transcript_15030~~Phypoly_transcript_15030.p1  ORF type:complete len:154 (+),score=25.93 Phypoly_transcript_15030:3-464(+)
MWEVPENRRKFFENYAIAAGFDPHVPENWYSQHLDLLSERAKSVIIYHNHSASQALVDLFPDIGLDKRKFTRQNYWDLAENRRKVFENYAKNSEFDPLQQLNWFSQPKEKVLAFKEVAKVLVHHGHSITRALADLFQFDKPQFFSAQRKLWKR